MAPTPGEGIDVGRVGQRRVDQENIRGLADALFRSGVIGGQVVYGGVLTGESLELHSNEFKDGLIKLGDSSAFNEANGRLGLGTLAPAVTLHAQSAADDQVTLRAEATNASGTSARGSVNPMADLANAFLIAHGSARTVARCGITLGGWTEVLALAGSGLLINTNGAVPVVFGANNVDLGRFDAAAAAANQTNLLLMEGSPRTSRRVKWKDGAALIAGDKVMVLV